MHYFKHLLTNAPFEYAYTHTHMTTTTVIIPKYNQAHSTKHIGTLLLSSARWILLFAIAVEWSPATFPYYTPSETRLIFSPSNSIMVSGSKMR